MSTRRALSGAHSYHTSSVPSIRWKPIGRVQHHLAQKGHGLLSISLHEKCVTEMIPGDRIGRAKFQLRAKLSGRRFEIALTQVDEAHEKVRFGKPRIKL